MPAEPKTAQVSTGQQLTVRRPPGKYLVDVYCDAFILPPHIPCPPAPPFMYHRLKGDGRSFARCFSARLWSYVAVDLEKSSPLIDRHHQVGESTAWYYPRSRNNPDGISVPDPSLGERADHATASDEGLTESVERAAEGVLIRIDGSVGIPLLIGAPKIDYHYEIRLTKAGVGSIGYTVRGAHDGFPWYSVYIGTRPVVQDAGIGELRLFGGGDIRVGEQGTLLLSEAYGGH